MRSPGTQVSSAKTTREAEVRVSPVPAALMPRMATLTSSTSWNLRSPPPGVSLLANVTPQCCHNVQGGSTNITFDAAVFDAQDGHPRILHHLEPMQPPPPPGVSGMGGMRQMRPHPNAVTKLLL